METIFNSVPVGLYRATLGGRLLQANPTMAELLGCPDVDALLAMNMIEFYANPADRARSLKALDRPGATATLETLFRRRNGSTVCVELFARRVDASPEPFLAGMVRDISARKHLEAQADRFTRAVAASGEVIFMTDRAGLFTYVNPEFTRVYGYEADELIGKQTPRILKSGRQTDAQYQTFWSDLVSGRSVVRNEFSNRRKDGGVVLMDASANAVFDERGAITGFLAIQRDITARRRTEHALHESEALFRRLFDELPVAAALLSSDGRFHRANAAYCQMIGWSEAELKERTFLDITHPEEREKSGAVAQDLRSGRIDQIDLEKRFVRRDGAVVWGAVSVRPIRDADGRVLWTMPIVIDVTERRRLEQQLRQAQKMEAVGQLAGGIAHDFNNILTAVLGYCELLLDRVGTDESLAFDLRQIQDGGHRAAALTKQLLAFSRKQVLRLEVADLNHVLERFHQLVRPIIGEDIELAFDLSARPVRLLADVGQLEQVAMNLVVNARDAMPDGGAIRLRTAAVRIEEGQASLHEAGMSPGDYVQFVVEDTGTGMTDETRRRLFEPFFTTKAPGKGTGLGLAVVYGIVQQMGGFIWVYSEPGRGTTFKLYFPRTERVGDAPGMCAVPMDRRPGDERILLVEDDREVRVFAGLVLRRQGYDVAEASSGAEALEHLRRAGRPHLVITDMVMPGMSGPELVRHLTKQYPGLKVVFTSGYMDHRVISAGGLEPGVELLEKPFTATVLLDRVRTTLDRVD